MLKQKCIGIRLLIQYPTTYTKTASRGDLLNPQQ